jgi:hypothetical protein
MQELQTKSDFHECLEHIPYKHNNGNYFYSDIAVKQVTMPQASQAVNSLSCGNFASSSWFQAVGHLPFLLPYTEGRVHGMLAGFPPGCEAASAH